jgi:predicted SprT family Zn-dependent metalloprotease
MSHFEAIHQPNKTYRFNKRNIYFYQPKLSINKPNDPHEREADAISERVMRMPVNEHPFFSVKPIAVSTLQRKCEACEEEEKLQRKETSSQRTEAGSEISSYINSLSSKGSSLPAKSKKFFESRFGHDFSDVKIHNDTDAANSAQLIHAVAYTSANNIVFNKNQFSPESDHGKQLLAHELTHVVQQKNSIKKSIQRQDEKTDDKKLQITKRVELPAPQDKLSSILTSPENKETEKEKPHLGFDFSKSLSANPPLFPNPETYGFSLVYRDLNLKSFGDDDAPFGIDIGHEPNVQLTLSPDPHNAQVYQAAFTLINLHFRRNKNEFIEVGLSPLFSYSQPSGTLAAGAQAQIELHVTSKFSLTASSGISASKHDDKAPVDYSSVLLGTTKGYDWNWSPVSVGMVWHFK